MFSELRGNIATRLAKAADFDAIVMAAAAIVRLGIEPEVWEPLPVEVMLPQVGQGALAVECRVDDTATVALLAAIDDGEAHRLTDAERAFLATLGGDCDLPAAAHATADEPGGVITLRSLLAAEDGTTVLRDTARATTVSDSVRRGGRCSTGEAAPCPRSPSRPRAPTLTGEPDRQRSRPVPSPYALRHDRLPRWCRTR